MATTSARRTTRRPTPTSRPVAPGEDVGEPGAVQRPGEELVHALVDTRRGSARPWTWSCPTRCPGPAPGRQALRVDTPSTPRGADHRASVPAPPTCAGGAGTGRTTPCTAWGSPTSTSPAVVATVLGLVPLRRLARSPVRDAALRADHGGGPEPRPGPEQTPEDPRPARSGSARTSRISMDTAH